ncbi:hypothetical protein [Cellulomonas sp. NS3]|uniref:hypothetical protein n=1 Tax=Cellulomonas sp. NS3 TaxID=2973977 RepID=UPI002163BFB7|nr:hypothetical protein [Cellulomonas sp. NS3]
MDVRRVLVRGLVAGLLVPLGVAAPAWAAAPEGVAVGCGDTVTGPAYLATDLDCDGVGVRLGADASLDLAGHVLDGGGSGTGVLVTNPAGGGAQSVSGGTLRGWDVAVRSDDVWPPESEASVDRQVVDVTFRDNVTAVGWGRDPAWWGTLAVHGSRFVGNDLAVESFFHGQVTADGSTFARNAEVVVARASRVVLRGADLRDNDVVVALVGEGDVLVEDSVLVRNRVVVGGTKQWGSVRIERSTVRRSDVVVAPGGVESSTWLVDDVLTDNAVVVDLVGESGGVVGSTFRRNGVAVRASAPAEGLGPFQVLDSTFRRNGDAILTTGPVELGGNLVTHSTGWGVLAPGAVDLGGNVASGNGHEPQCTGVVCASRPRS